jgi:hypothetical protein
MACISLFTDVRVRHWLTPAVVGRPLCPSATYGLACLGAAILAIANVPDIGTNGQQFSRNENLISGNESFAEDSLGELISFATKAY